MLLHVCTYWWWCMHIWPSGSHRLNHLSWWWSPSGGGRHELLQPPPGIHWSVNRSVMCGHSSGVESGLRSWCRISGTNGDGHDLHQLIKHLQILYLDAYRTRSIWFKEHSGPTKSFLPKQQSLASWPCGTSTSFTFSDAELKLAAGVFPLNCVREWNIVITLELRVLQQKPNFDEDHSTAQVTYDGGDFFAVAAWQGIIHGIILSGPLGLVPLLWEAHISTVTKPVNDRL